MEIIDNYFSQIFSRTVASENQEALSDWLKYASPEGKDNTIIMLVDKINQ